MKEFETEIVEAINQYPYWLGIEKELQHDTSKYVMATVVNKMKHAESNLKFELRSDLSSINLALTLLIESKDWRNLSNTSKQIVEHAKIYVDRLLEFSHSKGHHYLGNTKSNNLEN